MRASAPLLLTADEIGAIPAVRRARPRRSASGSSRAAADITLAPGEYAAHEGSERALFAVLEGRIEAVKLVDGIGRVVGERRPGDIFGEVPIALGTVFPVGFRAAEPSRVMRVEAQRLPRRRGRRARSSHRRSAGSPPTGWAARAGCRASPPSRRRRARSSSGTAGTRPARSCATSSTATRSPSGGSRPTPRTPPSTGAGPLPADEDWPAIRVVDGKTVVRPQLRRVAELLGLATEAAAAEYDAVIVGAGPAGLAAAVYGASEGLRTIVIEREAPGGQAGTSSRIENYLGFPSGVSGDELASRALQQARRLGAEILVTRSITRIDAGDAGRCTSTAATCCGRGRSSSPAASRGGSSRSTGSTGSPARASPTARRAARRPPPTASTSTSSARATRPGRPRCSSPTTRGA